MITGQVLPCVQDLVSDTSDHVRTSLARVIMELASLVGKDASSAQLNGLYLRLLKDETSEVRLAIISNISSLAEVDGLSECLTTAVLELSADRMWRVRSQIIKYMPVLAKKMGDAAFQEKMAGAPSSLFDLCISWLKDEVHSIREAAAENLKNLADVFGSEWTLQKLIPAIIQAPEGNYLYRLTRLKCCELLADMDTKAVLLPKVLEMAEDKVPNVRFNVAQTLVKIVKNGCGMDAATVAAVRPSLQTLTSDTDNDVQHFSQLALTQLEGA